MFFTQAQEHLSYGVLVGGNAFEAEIEGDGLSGGDGYSAFNKEGFPLNIGGFVNYGINESFGVKTNLFYKGNYRSIVFDDLGSDFDQYVSSIQLQPMLVYDVSKNYGKGFYLLAGPGFDFKLNEKYIGEDEVEFDDFYKSFHVDALFGFGFTFSPTIGMEFIGNYGLTNWLDRDDFTTSNAGGYVHFYVNLESLLAK